MWNRVVVVVVAVVVAVVVVVADSPTPVGHSSVSSALNGVNKYFCLSYKTF